MSDLNGRKTIATILKHESKRNTYKIALVRAINDVALEYAHVPVEASGIAIPLRLLAQFWLAYYWAFADPAAPIRQGHDSTDLSFRAELTQFRSLWEGQYGEISAAEGFFVKNEMSIPRRAATYPSEVREAYWRAVKRIMQALQQPIRYAGTGMYTLFEKPRRFGELAGVAAIPATEPGDLCLVVPQHLWAAFRDLSLWIEALCVHEWCLFTDTVDQPDPAVQRGLVYTLLTARPDNRRPLTWERNQVDILLLEGRRFTCPWTYSQIVRGTDYDMDHIIPIAVRPINELWNLVPCDAYFNSHVKRDRLPSEARLLRAKQPLLETYTCYEGSRALRQVLYNDAHLRFGALSEGEMPVQLVEAVVHFALSLADLRNIARFY